MQAWVPLGSSLKQAFARCSSTTPAGWPCSTTGATGRFRGVLTPARLHEALRRSIDADARAVPRAAVSLETVAGV